MEITHKHVCNPDNPVDGDGWNDKHIITPLLYGYELVEEKTISLGTTSVIFTGLNGDVDEEYLLTGDIVLTSDFPSLMLVPNNDTGGTYVGTSFYSLNPSATGAATTTHIRVCQSNNSATTYVKFEGKFYPKTGAYRQALFNATHALSGRSLVTINGGHWANTTDNITSIVLVRTSATGSFSGKIQLWKRIKPEVV